MEVRSKKPSTLHRTSEEIIGKVIEIRKETYRNEYAIASYLERRGVFNTS